MSLFSSTPSSKADCRISVLQDPNGNEKIPMLQLPRSSSLALASDQCCTCEAINIATSSKKVHSDRLQLSAFVNAYDSTNIELYCEEKFVHTFQLFPKTNNHEHDTVLNVKLVPVPSDCDIVTPEYEMLNKNDDDCQIFGVFVVLGTLRKGLTMHSVLLRKTNATGIGATMATTEVVCVRTNVANNEGSTNHLEGRRLQKMVAKFVYSSNNANPSPYHLLIATSSSKVRDDNSISSSQRIDCFTYDFNIQDEKINIKFPDDSMSISSCMLVNDVSIVKSLEFGKTLESGISNLAILTSTELILVELRLLQKPSEEVNMPTSRLLLAGCHPTHQLGTAQAVISLGYEHQEDTIEGGNNEIICESFAVICDARTTELFSYSPAKTMTPLSDLGTDILHTSLSAVRTSRSASYDLIQGQDESRDVLHALANVTPDDSDIIDLTGKIGLGNVTADQSAGSSLEGMDLVESQDSPLIAKCLLSEEKYTRRKRASDNLIQSELYPDHLAHILLVTVECNTKVSPSSSGPSMSSTVASFPPQFSSFDAIALCRIHQNTQKYIHLTPSTPEKPSESELMFSPSPGSNMTHSNISALSEETRATSTDFGSLKLALVCASKDSSELHFMVLSARKSILKIDSQENVDIIEGISRKTSEEEMSLIRERCSVKSISIEEQHESSYDGDAIGLGVQIRVVMSVDTPIDEDNDPDESGRLPINIALKENGGVAILNLLHQLQKDDDVDKAKDETHRVQMSKGSNRSYNGYSQRPENTAFETNVLQKLDCLMQTLESFETKMTRRMDAMEHLMLENSERLSSVEELVHNNK